MEITKQVTLSAANFWAGASMTKAAYQYMQAEQEISRRDKRVSVGSEGGTEMQVGKRVLVDEFAQTTRQPEERSAEAEETFINMGLVVIAAYTLGTKDAEDTFHLRNLKTPLQILENSQQYARNKNRMAVAAALGITDIHESQEEMVLPDELIHLYDKLVAAWNKLSDNEDVHENIVVDWIDEHKTRLIESVENILDGARKRFEKGQYAGDASELLELRTFNEQLKAA